MFAGTENLFPLVPADTAVALGAFLSAGGRISALTVFLVTWVANVTTAAGVYVAARTAGRTFFRGRVGSKLLRPKALARIEALYERHGTWAIFLSRFVPGVRALVPPFAGVAGLGAVRALVPLVIASGIWYGALTYVAATAIRNIDEIGSFVGGLNRLVLAIVGVALLIVLILMHTRRGKGRRRA
ncbi:MAG: DedA family protein [Gemmatimonadetes bacterium]|nr:DedA family protein [Gemmatimonadota bacterium]